ncbi:flagellar motor switch protein FliG, partial [bacterium]|nr:flagellar motor switch protein FliG [bacterium]
MAVKETEKIDLSSSMGSLKKAAIFMISIGQKASSEIFKHFSDNEIELLSTEIARLENVTSEELISVDNEFEEMILAQQYITSGGVAYAQGILENAVGPSRALEIIRKVQASLQIKGFNVLENIDHNQLILFLQKEHPQTIAVVLTQMPSNQAANILVELTPEVQVDVVYRISKMDRVSPETLSAVEKVLESNIEFTQGTSKFGGLKTAAEMLNMVGARFEKNI